MIIPQLHTLLQLCALSAMLVFLAMMIDLISGLYKAKIRGDARRSKALRRTAWKFITYEGAIVIASIIDVFIHLSKVLQFIKWDIFNDIPLITIMMGIFICIVEMLSIREKAKDKSSKHIAEAEHLLCQILEKDDIIKLLKRLAKIGEKKGTS